jgi:hypothetical protein
MLYVYIIRQIKPKRENTKCNTQQFLFFPRHLSVLEMGLTLRREERSAFQCRRLTEHSSGPHPPSDGESELLYDWPLTANQFVLATSSLRITTSNFIFQLNTCYYNPYVTSFLTRGWVCRLQLLPVLTSAIILRPESHGTHNHILLSQIRDCFNLEGPIPVFLSPKNRVARLYPQTLGYCFVASYDSHG